MGGLKLDDFAGAVGETWSIEAGDAVVPLRLEVAEPLPRALRAEGGFRLEWTGPGEPFLPQAIYRFTRADAVCEMFIVPVARTSEGGFRYEAVFN